MSWMWTMTPGASRGRTSKYRWVDVAAGLRDVRRVDERDVSELELPVQPAQVLGPLGPERPALPLFHRAEPMRGGDEFPIQAPEIRLQDAHRHQSPRIVPNDRMPVDLGLGAHGSRAV